MTERTSDPAIDTEPVIETDADLYAGFPLDLPKPQVEITEAAARLARAIYG